MTIRRKTLRLMVVFGAVFRVGGRILAAKPLPAASQSAAPGTGGSAGTGTGTGIGRGPAVILTGEFWAAMEKLSRSQDKTYGDRQEPLLEKIAVASEFVVKTNLTLIRQNDRIIQLLEELNRKRGLQER